MQPLAVGGMPSAFRIVTQFMKSTVWKRTVRRRRCVDVAAAGVLYCDTESQCGRDVADAPCLGEATDTGEFDRYAIDETTRVRFQKILEARDAFIKDERAPARRPDPCSFGK